MTVEAHPGKDWALSGDISGALACETIKLTGERRVRRLKAAPSKQCVRGGQSEEGGEVTVQVPREPWNPKKVLPAHWILLKSCTPPFKPITYYQDPW